MQDLVSVRYQVTRLEFQYKNVSISLYLERLREIVSKFGLPKIDESIRILDLIGDEELDPIMYFQHSNRFEINNPWCQSEFQIYLGRLGYFSRESC